MAPPAKNLASLGPPTFSGRGGGGEAVKCPVSTRSASPALFICKQGNKLVTKDLKLFPRTESDKTLVFPWPIVPPLLNHMLIKTFLGYLNLTTSGRCLRKFNGGKKKKIFYYDLIYLTLIKLFFYFEFPFHFSESYFLFLM